VEASLQDFQGSIRSSILKEMIKGSYKAKPKEAESISPDIVSAVESIEGGVPLSSAARSLQQRRGSGLNPKEMSILQSAESRRIAKTNFGTTQGFKEKQSNRLSPNEVIKVQDGYDAYKAASDLKQAMENNMSLFGPLKGRIGSLNPYDEDAQAVNAAIYAAKQSIGKFLEGGVLRAEDEKKYERMLPSLGDAPAVAQSKLDIMFKKMSDKASGYRTSLARAGYDVTPFQELEAALAPLSLSSGGAKGTKIGESAGAADVAIGSVLGKKPKKGGEQKSHAPSQYAEENSKAITLLEGYKKQVGEGSAYQRKRSQVDAFLKDKYGKGLSE
jgi:hypothetical protein